MTKPAVMCVAVVAISLGIGLTGCGSDSKPADTPAAESPPATAPTSPTTSTAAQASDPQTIGDYLTQNNIKPTPVFPGTPGAPRIEFQSVDGWQPIPASGRDYWGISMDSTAGQARITAVFERLDDTVDPDRIYELAPGELKKKPGFSIAFQGDDSLDEQPAYQISGSNSQNGTVRAEKTLVLKGTDGAFYLLQLVAEGPEAAKQALGDATVKIDNDTEIEDIAPQ